MILPFSVLIDLSGQGIIDDRRFFNIRKVSDQAGFPVNIGQSAVSISSRSFNAIRWIFGTS